MLVELRGERPLCAHVLGWSWHGHTGKIPPAVTRGPNSWKCTSSVPNPSYDGQYMGLGTGGWSVPFIETQVTVNYARTEDGAAMGVTFDLQGKLRPQDGRVLTFVKAVIVEKGVELWVTESVRDKDPRLTKHFPRRVDFQPDPANAEK